MKQAVTVGAWIMTAGFACLLAACTTTGTGVATGTSTTRSAEVPVAQQQATGTRQRAKIHVELGALYLQDGRLPVALQEGRIAVEADSTYALGYNLLGLVYMAMDDNALAEENFKRALSLAPGDPDISNNYGWFICNAGRFAESLPYFRTAFQHPLYQAPGKALTNAGMCAYKLKDYAAAESYLNSALRYNRSNTLALYWRGEVYLSTKRLEEARMSVADLSKMIDPTPDVAWLGLRVERAAGDRDAEMRYATQLRRRFPESPQYQQMIKGEYE